MKPSTIKNLDFYIGKPLCFVLTVYNLFKRLLFRKCGNRKTQKIVFIKLVEQGATVLAYSAIQRAVELVGRANVFFCVFKDNRPIFDILNIIPEENIFEIRQDNLVLFAYDMLKFFIRTRKLEIDTAIDMEFFSRASALISYFSGASKRIGYHRYTSEYPYRGDLMTHRVQYNPYIHVAKAYLILVESALLSPDEVPMAKIKADDLKLSFPRFVPSQEELQKVKRLLQEYGKGEAVTPLVVLNPNASDMLPLRKWEKEKFIHLARRLLDAYSGLTIVFTGSASESLSVEEISRRLGSDRVINLAGRTTLRDLITLYSISDVFVTNDSGPGHFATLTGIHTIVLFGPETPGLFGPLGSNVHIIYKKMACSPCVNVFNHRFSPCADNVCMKRIDVESVFEQVCDKLTREI